MIFVKSFTQARFQQIWKFTPITRKPRHVLPPKTPFKSKQMWDSPTVLLRYALSLLYNIKLIKNYTKIFEITQDMSSPAKNLPNVCAGRHNYLKIHIYFCQNCDEQMTQDHQCEIKVSWPQASRKLAHSGQGGCLHQDLWSSTLGEKVWAEGAPLLCIPICLVTIVCYLIE